jgi:hypothetical protein
MGMSHQQTSGLTMAAKVTVVRLLTVGVTVWLLQRYAFSGANRAIRPASSLTSSTALSRLWSPLESASPSIWISPTH